MVVVWFKRDLRLLDHEPLSRATKSGEKILLLYSFEPFWVNDAHYSEKHFNFIKQSLEDLQRQLRPFDTQILVLREAMVSIFDKISSVKSITHLYSHQETGMKSTFDRDKQVKKWCEAHNVRWSESIQNGVFRGIKNRQQWKNNWIAFINQPIEKLRMETGNFYNIEQIEQNFQPLFEKVNLTTKPSKQVQYGGTATAIKYLDTFVAERINSYNTHYSKPATSRRYSSRISPYLAWGNVSTRQVCQFVVGKKHQIGNKRNLSAFLSRMRWQAHFIQKFEMEGEMEFQSINKGYHQLIKPRKPQLQEAWKQGRTGIPLVDAAMRCLVATGFVNFRLRAMLASFFTHLLWQPWQDCTEHLAHHFLDFEPGIHFPQLNMQSGETGVNTIRIYNPVKNSKEHDPEGVFIKKWVPQLSKLPKEYVHEPWKIPAMELQFLGFELGRDYLHPIVDIEKMRTFASKTLHEYKKNANVKSEGRRIVKKHTLPGRPVWDQHE